jgi:hypothetical protein
MPGLGHYFLDSLFADIELLTDYSGVHASVFGYHRSLSKRFPFAIYYRVKIESCAFAPFSTVEDGLLGSGSGFASNNLLFQTACHFHRKPVTMRRLTTQLTIGSLLTNGVMAKWLPGYARTRCLQSIANR